MTDRMTERIKIITASKKLVEFLGRGLNNYGWSGILIKIKNPAGLMSKHGLEPRPLPWKATMLTITP